MAFEFTSATIITDTNAHTGRFGKVHALADASCTFVSSDLTENGSSTINGITMNAGTEIEDVVITSITLASGQGVAYRI